MAPSEEDEWEFEYDDTETEDFYIPVDVANVPELQAPVNEPSRRLGHPWLLKTKLRAFYANRQEVENVQIPSTTPDGQESATMGEIQAIGLHTSNPLIMHNGQLLSCSWVSSLGTDLIFAKPNTDVEDADAAKPLRKLPEVDLIALGSVRLVARLGRLRPKDELFEQVEGELPEGESMHTFVPVQEAAPETIDQESRREAQSAPSGFLAKLNAAKANRGDTTRLALHKTTNGSRLIAEEVEVQPPDDAEQAEDAATMIGT
ncbi:hypothetical protein P280DRAFT_30484 [Massarina eburnea CBS 473.64]|uniref:Transcription factor TFIIIC triple barrel domain-containing protein n=1 Tax=Massarina eburnea CBS 473.64 TaxID=1395130 RepID=A0A6A6RY00_9PLEO|nr:hypothetical protein P280DRAFT_30484 [Massarina eburnea CBS 473.64]